MGVSISSSCLAVGGAEPGRGEATVLLLAALPPAVTGRGTSEGTLVIPPGAEGTLLIPPGAEGTLWQPPGEECTRLIPPGAEGTLVIPPGGECTLLIPPGEKHP